MNNNQKQNPKKSSGRPSGRPGKQTNNQKGGKKHTNKKSNPKQAPQNKQGDKQAKKDDKRGHIFETTLRVTRKGVGFADLPDREDSVRIEHEDLKTALHGDRVRLTLHPHMPGKLQTGEITEIIYRYRTQFVGTVDKRDAATFVIPDDQRMYQNFILNRKDAEQVESNQKVHIKMTEWTDMHTNPAAALISVIGNKGDNETEMQAILYEQGLTPKFPPEVEKEAQRIPHTISDEEIDARRDMREVETFTIDPETAKDFDDALSFREREDGNIEIGIHIADVTHYVTPGSAMDEEAAKRGVSIYLVDRTIPMLPEALSNDLCSLNPNEDKLAFSAVFTISKEALKEKKIDIVEEWFGRTVIHSNTRFTYEDAQEVLDSKEGPHENALETINGIAKILQKKRFDEGAIAFEKDEVAFELDAEGTPIAVHIKKRFDANKLIEEFMLLANKRVAEFIEKKDPDMEQYFIYRVHDVPDQDKIAELSAFLKTLGYELKSGPNGPRSKDVNNLLNEIRGSAEEDLIQTAMIRSMSKAVYSTKNIGHYGLSFKHYTHFTSPIRRYPDMMVHRLLATYLSGKKPSKEQMREYEACSRYVSEMEQTAAEAERNSIKYKQAEFMQDKVGKVFTATITGVVEWGLYVSEDTSKAEGLIHISNLPGDYYTLDENKYSLIGEKTKRKFQLGDSVTVRLTGVDLDKRQIDYELVN